MSQNHPAMEQEFFKHLPPEIVIDILSRLPVRTVISCKCVQKSWHRLVETQEFIRSHLSKSAPGLITREYPREGAYGLFEYKLFELEDGLDVERHDLRYKLVTKFSLKRIGWVMGSIDGLLLLSNPLCICNPITRDCINIDYPQEFNKPSPPAISYGFGSSKVTGQYKLVQISHDRIYNLSTWGLLQSAEVECRVYTLGTGSWRRSASRASIAYINQSIASPAVFMNGNLHWLVYDLDRRIRILCFDLETEQFSTLFGPRFQPRSLFGLELFMWGDCVCVSDNTSRDKFVIWVMKEYGVEKSWTKEIVISNVPPCGLLDHSKSYPVKVFKDGDILILWHGLFLYYYSSKTKTVQKLNMRHLFNECHTSAFLHTPSFVSLKSFGLDRKYTPTTPHLIVKSSSLPRLGSPTRYAEPFLPHSRSAEDMSTLYSRKKETMREAIRQVEYQERDDSMLKNTGADDTDEHYNYVDLAKDWIIPENMEKSFKGETSFSHSDEVPAKDFRLRRIEEWVTNLQDCGPLEESNESAPCVDDELPKVNALTLGPTVAKVEDKVNPGMKAAKRYISSLNSSATAAQLTNLGLTVIPFLSVFVSLKALNLSGNSIARIVAGALPRGLHVLNLSKNNISTIEGLRDLTRLHVLDLSYNRILRIGHGLSGCSSIKELYLAGNKISEVEGLHRLLKLNVLDLRFNKISTTKCLGQLAANYNCLHALSLEGNPAQKNVGDDQLKKYVLSLLPKLTYYNRQPIKVGIVKDGSDRSARLSIGSHQSKTVRKATHGRKSQALASPKPTRSRHGRPPPTGMKTATNHQFPEISSRLVTLRSDFSFPRSRSEGNLGAL